MSGAARDEILASIRRSLADVPGSEQPGDVPVPREYRTAELDASARPVDAFVERVREYKATVRVITRAELPGAIASAFEARGVKRIVAPADLHGDWVPPGVFVLRDPGLTNEQIETSDGVLTAARLGIAQTGTIVLDSGPGQGRRVLSLLPDYHLCVIRADQLVALVPEAIGQLAEDARRPGRPITLISGPSATSDIELSRVEGVHGPRTLEVLVVDSGASVEESH
jgi:L-lactate dehydrogenase complex protein LldG